MIYISILILTIYITLITSFIVGFSKLKIFRSDAKIEEIKFSIIIPFRNETKNLDALLNSLQHINYPENMFEILLIDDESEDNSKAIIENFISLHKNLNITISNNKRKTNSPKKDAINTAIDIAKHDWIITTDADCEVPKNWLQNFNSFIKNNKTVFISAPVQFKAKSTFLFHFQNLNFLSLIGSTIGAFGINNPFLCNGANLCYKKSAFNKVGGFNGNSSIASGDDIFLLEKMTKSFPSQTSFLKSKTATIHTNSEDSWSSFFNQQIRWSSKSSKYNNWFSKGVGVVVLLTNMFAVILLALLFFNNIDWEYTVAFMLLKMIIDFILILKTAIFLDTRKSLKYFPLVSLIYPMFLVSIGILSLFKNYDWKGRSFSK